MAQSLGCKDFDVAWQKLYVTKLPYIFMTLLSVKLTWKIYYGHHIREKGVSDVTSEVFAAASWQLQLAGALWVPAISRRTLFLPWNCSRRRSIAWWQWPLEAFSPPRVSRPGTGYRRLMAHMLSSPRILTLVTYTSSQGMLCFLNV